MPTYTFSMRWVGSLLALTAALTTSVGRGVESTPKGAPQQSHVTEDMAGPGPKNPGYVRPRLGSEDTVPAGGSDYVEVGPIPDDLAVRLEEAMKTTGLLPDPKTGEKKPTDAQTLSKNQKRPDLAEPTPAPVF